MSKFPGSSVSILSTSPMVTDLSPYLEDEVCVHSCPNRIDLSLSQSGFSSLDQQQQTKHDWNAERAPNLTARVYYFLSISSWVYQAMRR